MPSTALVIVLLGVLAAAAIGTRWLAGFLRRRAVLDRPNERSSHARPTPRGGGIAVVVTIAGGWAALALVGAAASPPLAIALGAALLAGVSWADDLRGLSAGIRLAAQAAAVALGIAALPGDALVFQGLLPPALDRALTFVAWLWFVNLYNFMDGIDGMSGVETASLGIGLALVAGIAHTAPEPALGLVVAAAVLGFLIWNWHPARIFLGDVGSVTLGYALGWLLIMAAASGLWAAALILPLYYLADATVTLLRRIARGEKFWRAHREHFYQIAASGTLGHAGVARNVLACNAGLIALGVGATIWPAATLPALIVAALGVAALLTRLASAGR